VTKGARAKVQNIAKRLALDSLVSRFIEGPKQPELYSRVLRFTGAPQRAFMVGDQVDRDIALAKDAGLETIYLPGGFRPRWAAKRVMVQPDHRIESFAEVPSIVLYVPLILSRDWIDVNLPDERRNADITLTRAPLNWAANCPTFFCQSDGPAQALVVLR
jgi:hypothetical protein